MTEPLPDRPAERAELGTPITTEQATRAVLRMLNTPMIGDIELDASPGITLQRIEKDSYHLLSGGEKRLVDIARAIWSPPNQGARISVLGGLDRTLRRKVLTVLAYLYLGRDSLHLIEVDHADFTRLFGDAS